MAVTALDRLLLAQSPSTGSWWRRAADALWVGWPRWIGVVSQVLAALFLDGGWIRAIPPVAVLLPPVAFGAGFWEAVHQAQPLWSFGYSPAVLMAVAAGLGCGVGLWAAIGYLVGLLLFFTDSHGLSLSHTRIGGYVSFSDLRRQGKGFWAAFAHTYLGLLVAVFILFALGVLVPAVAVGCRTMLSPLLRQHRVPRLLGEGVVSTLVVSFGAWQWTLAVQYAIRPYWTLGGTAPDVRAFDPVRAHSTLIWQLALAASVVRWLVTVSRPAPRLLQARRSLPSLPLWWPISVAAQASVVTLLACGSLADVHQGVIFGAVVAAGLILRKLVFPRIPGVARVVNSVPLLIRLAMIFLLDDRISAWRVGAAYHSGSQSLGSFAQTAAATIGLASLLLVARRPEPWLPPWVLRSRGHRGPAGPPGAAPGPSTMPPTGPRGSGRTASGQFPPGPDPGVPVRGSEVALIVPQGRLFRRSRFVLSVLAVDMVWAVVTAPSAAADNCSSLSDCSTAVTVGIAAAVALGLLALGVFGLPALLAAGAADAAAVNAAAEAAAVSYEAAQASGVIAAAAAEQATAAAAAIAEAADAGLIGSEAATAAAEAAAEANAAAMEAAEATNAAQRAALQAFEALQTGDVAAAEAAQAAAAQAAESAAAAATDANGAALEAEIAGVNPAGAVDNCGYVAQAVDDRLAGDAASFADPNGLIDLSELESAYGEQFQATSAAQISQTLAQAGNGARGIIAVNFPRSAVGHLVNVVEQGGQTFFIDGQSGTVSTTLTGVLNGQTPSLIRFIPTFP